MWSYKIFGKFSWKLVVLEGFNNASPVVLEVLSLIYGKKQTKLLLPNGSTITKGNMFLISIINPTDDFIKKRLPINLINNSIYLIVDQILKILKILLKNFLKNMFKRNWKIYK